MAVVKKTNLQVGVYRHYKGGMYRVVGVAKHSETLEDLVVYEMMYDNEVSKLWVRPLDIFLGEVEVDGQRQKRFILTQD